MDNNELDKILKEKLKLDVKPSQEFENKINKLIEEEKTKHKESRRIFYGLYFVNSFLHHQLLRLNRSVLLCLEDYTFHLMHPW